MLARRFIIVCLLATLFAMTMIALIQQATGPAHSLKIDHSLPCIYEAPQRCTLN